MQAILFLHQIHANQIASALSAAPTSKPQPPRLIVDQSLPRPSPQSPPQQASRRDDAKEENMPPCIVHPPLMPLPLARPRLQLAHPMTLAPLTPDAAPIRDNHQTPLPRPVAVAGWLLPDPTRPIALANHFTRA